MPRSVEDICKVLVKNERLVASCNGFVAEVAQQVAGDYNIAGLTVAFIGKADEIIGRFERKPPAAPFIFIGRKPELATQLAAEGQFVVGGLSKDEMTYFFVGRKIVTAGTKGAKQRKASMGHIVIIAPGGPSKSIASVQLADGNTQAARGGYPYCYQGAAHEAFRFSDKTQVDVVFPSLILDKVNYAYIKLT